MNTKKLRQTAERLDSWDRCDDVSEHVYHIDSDLMQDDIRSIVKHILATVQEDGEEILTQDYIDKTCNLDDQHDVYVDSGGHLVIDTPKASLSAHGVNRSQFRALCQGLGIEPQKISEKR